MSVCLHLELYRTKSNDKGVKVIIKAIMSEICKKQIPKEIQPMDLYSYLLYLFFFFFFKQFHYKSESEWQLHIANQFNY